MRASSIVWLFLVIQPLTVVAQPHEQDIGEHLRALDALAAQALKAAEQGATAADLSTLRRHVDRVYATVWGMPSGLAGKEAGAEAVHGWKTRWQVNNDAFDPAFAERYGTTPPEVEDPARLGVIGRGRRARALLQAIVDDPAHPAAERNGAEAVIAGLNNVIGWMRMDDGVTKAERQPRVDLTYQWDAPAAFWLSSADTGWWFEVQAQALNILKTDYAGDLSEARRHTTDLVALIRKARTGLDADGDGRIAPMAMEAGLDATLAAARAAGLLSD